MFLKVFSTRSIGRSLAVLASGTAAGQAIVLLSSPILTRLYTAEQFGLLAFYTSIVIIVGAASTLRYEMAIPLVRREDTAINVLVLTLACVLGVSLLSVPALVIGMMLFQSALEPGAWLAFWLIPFGIFGAGAYTALSHLAVRRRSFGIIARTKLMQAVSQTAIQIGAAFTPFATFGLLFGNLAGQTGGISTLIRSFWRQDRPLIARIRLRRMWLLARQHWHFPVFSLPASVANRATLHAPALIMFWLFGPATAGFYLLAQRVGMMPVTLLSNALSQIYHRGLAERKKEPAIVGGMMLRQAHLMIGLIVAPAILAAMIAPPVTGQIFGDSWVEAGHYLRWMAPWVAVTLVFGAMSPVVSVMGYERLGLVFQVGSLLIAAAAMLAAGMLWGPVAAIAGFSIIKTISIIVYRLHMLRLLGVSPWPLALNLLAQTAGFLLVCWGAIAAYGLGEPGSLTGLGLSALLLAVAAAAYVALNIRTYRKGAVSGLPKGPL